MRPDEPISGIENSEIRSVDFSLGKRHCYRLVSFLDLQAGKMARSGSFRTTYSIPVAILIDEDRRWLKSIMQPILIGKERVIAESFGHSRFSI